jgi:hypothetical protein
VGKEVEMLSLLSSVVFQYILLGFCILLIASTHILSVFCKQNFVKALVYIAIPMHFLLFFALALLGAQLEVVLLTFLALLCVYLAPRYALYRREQGRAECALGSHSDCALKDACVKNSCEEDAQ